MIGESLGRDLPSCLEARSPRACMGCQGFKALTAPPLALSPSGPEAVYPARWVRREGGAACMAWAARGAAMPGGRGLRASARC